jgi:hypothetical protein
MMKTWLRPALILTLTCLAIPLGPAAAQSPGPVVISELDWMGTATSADDENTLIIHDASLAGAYYVEWARLWAALGEETPCAGDAYQVFLPMMLRNATGATEPPIRIFPVVLSLDGASVHAGSDLRVAPYDHEPSRECDVYFSSASLGDWMICSSLMTDAAGSFPLATCHVSRNIVPDSYQLISVLAGRDPTPANHVGVGDVVEVLP